MTKWLQDTSVYFKGNVGVMMVSWLIYAVGSSITVPYLSIYIKYANLMPSKPYLFINAPPRGGSINVGN